MSQRTLRIATRKSPLAMWQAEHVADRLKALHPDLHVELVGMSTQGDKILDTPLAKIGGKALFVKELEQGMAEGRADIAVHSMKDVPAQLPEGFDLPVIMAREDPFDAFVSNSVAEFDDLPQGAILGTASMRRQCQLLARRPDLEVRTLRGNVNTRLAKLDAGEYDAIVLACSGLKRLEFHDRIRQSLPPEISLPAVGQGALGIECRADDDAVRELIAPLADTDTTYRVLAERAMNARLEGGCQVPIAGYAVLQDGQIHLRGLVGALDGSEVIRGEIRGAPEDGPALGRQLGEDLLARGAGRILKQIYG